MVDGFFVLRSWFLVLGSWFDRSGVRARVSGSESSIRILDPNPTVRIQASASPVPTLPSDSSAPTPMVYTRGFGREDSDLGILTFGF